MGQLNATMIIQQEQGIHSCLDDADRALVKRSLALQWKVKERLADGGTAGTGVAAMPVYTNDEGCNVRLKGSTLFTPVVVTGDNTNNATLTIDRVDATGANATTMATITTNVATGNFVAAVGKALAIAAGAQVPSGWTVRVTVTKGGTGVALGSATASAMVELVLEREQ